MILSRCERSCRLPTGRHASWLHLPNWSPRQELHPHDDVRSVACCLLHHAGKVVRPARFARALLLVRTEADCLVADGRKVSAAGIAPACIRLEDGALSCSRHAEETGAQGRNPTCGLVLRRDAL